MWLVTGTQETQNMYMYVCSNICGNRVPADKK